MSPRAAWRLESLGFTDVRDYVAGKLDWLAAGLPTEGANAQRPRAKDVARKDVPTCNLSERLSDVRDRVRVAGWDTCVVVNETGIVFGLLRSRELEDPRDLRIEEVMRPGPSTFRPHVAIEEMAKFMTGHELEASPITTSDGRLAGMLRRGDAAKAALELRQKVKTSEEAQA